MGQSVWTAKDESYSGVDARRLVILVQVLSVLLLSSAAFMVRQYIGGVVVSERYIRLDFGQKLAAQAFLMVGLFLIFVVLQWLLFIIIAAALWIALFFSSAKSNYRCFKIFDKISYNSGAESECRKLIADFAKRAFLWSSVRKEYGPALLSHYSIVRGKSGNRRDEILRRAANTGYQPALFTQALSHYSIWERWEEGRQSIRRLAEEKFIPAILYDRYLEQYDTEELGSIGQAPSSISILSTAEIAHLLAHVDHSDDDQFRFRGWKENWLENEGHLKWEWERLNFYWDQCFSSIADRLTPECIDLVNRRQLCRYSADVYAIHRSAVSVWTRSHRLSLAKHLLKGVGVKQNEGAAYAWLSKDTNRLGDGAEDLLREVAGLLSFDERRRYGEYIDEWQRIAHRAKPSDRKRELDCLLGLSDVPVKSSAGSRVWLEGMSTRTGHVFGWAGNLVGILGVGLGLMSNDWFGQALLIGGGALAFLVGRSMRYILAGSFI